MNKINKLLIAFIAIALASCGTDLIEDLTPDTPTNIAGIDYPATEKTDDYYVTYQYNKGVIVLDEKSLTYLEKIEADTILYFSQNTPSSILPTVGDIVSARVTSKTPYGLGNMVLERSVSGDLIRCVTTTTALDNIFKELTWECNAMLTDSILSGYTDEEGNTIEPSFVWYDPEGDSIINEAPRSTRLTTVQQAGTTLGHEKLVSLPFEYHPKHGHFSDVKVSGQISIGALVHCSGNIKSGTFHFYVKPIVDVSSASKLGIMYNQNIFQDIDEYLIFKLKDIIKGVIQLGPISLRPYLDVETYIDFGASGTVDMNFGKTFSAKIGYNQKNGAYIVNSTKDDSSNRFVKSIVLDGNIVFGIKCKFDAGCGLYTKNIAIEINPQFNYSLGADLRLSDNSNGWNPSSTLNFDINLGASGRVLFKLFRNLILTPTLEFFDTNIFHKEWPLMPTIEPNSFSLNRKPSNPFVFEAKYNITGGLLSLFGDIYPEIAVYKEGKLVYKKDSSPKTTYNKTQTAVFTLDGLTVEGSYTAKPVITVCGIEKKLEGAPFTILCPDGHHPHVIDMGNGVRFSCCNIGASSPTQYGNYFEWKDSPSAASSWGAGWEVPSSSQFQYLVSNCEHKWVSINQVNGMMFMGANGASIFFPAAGIRKYNNEMSGVGTDGSYWAKEHFGDEPDNGGYALLFRSDNMLCVGGGFCYSYTVRPVVK